MMIIIDVKFDIKYDQILQNSSQELSMSSKHDCDLGTHLFIICI